VSRSGSSKEKSSSGAAPLALPLGRSKESGDVTT
jgi:hypothetical protein